MTGRAYQQPEDQTMTEHGAIITLARYRARQLVRQRLLDQGRKLQSVSPRDVTEAADDLLAQQPQLFDEAREMIRQSPALQRLIKRPRKRIKKPSANSTLRSQ
jgi:hypothetical protein